MVEVNTIVKLLCEFVIFIGAIRFYWYRHPFIQSHTFAQPDRQTVNVHNCGAKEFSNKVSFCIGNATKDEATNGWISSSSFSSMLFQNYQYHRSKLDTFVVASWVGRPEKLKYFKLQIPKRQMDDI